MAQRFLPLAQDSLSPDIRLTTGVGGIHHHLVQE